MLIITILLFLLLNNFAYLIYHRKPITHKGKKAVLRKEPKLIEDAKETLCLRGKHTSQIVVDIMKDLVNIYIQLLLITVI